MAVPDLKGEVASANRALSHIGRQSALSDLGDQNSKSARVIKLHFGQVRDTVLRTYDFSFSKSQKVLTPVAPDALTGKFTKAWNWPAGALRILSVRPLTKREWRTEEKRRILTASDATTLTCNFVRQVTDTSEWDPLAVDLFEHELAIAIAPELTHSRALRLDCERQLDTLRGKCTLIDALEQDSEDDDYDGDNYVPGYIAARFGC